jgi:hypothetical protein
MPNTMEDKIQRFNTANTRSHHCTRSRESSIHLQLSQPMSLRLILTLSSYFPLGITSGRFTRDFPIKTACTTHPSHPNHTSSQSTPSMFHSLTISNDINHEIPRYVSTTFPTSFFFNPDIFLIIFSFNCVLYGFPRKEAKLFFCIY